MGKLRYSLSSVKYTQLSYYRGKTLCCRFIGLEVIQSNFQTYFYFQPISPSGAACFISLLPPLSTSNFVVFVRKSPLPSSWDSFLVLPQWPPRPSPQGPVHMSESKWMGTFAQALGFLPRCIPNHLHREADRFFALWKRQSNIISSQRSSKLLPTGRTELRRWTAARRGVPPPAVCPFPVTCHPAQVIQTHASVT